MWSSHGCDTLVLYLVRPRVARRRVGRRASRVVPSQAMSASHLRTTRVRRGFALLAVSTVVGTATLLACSDDDGTSADDGLPTSSVYVPAEAAAQDPPPPGVTAHPPEQFPAPTPTPKDSGASDSGGGTPKDSGSPDA